MKLNKPSISDNAMLSLSNKIYIYKQMVELRIRKHNMEILKFETRKNSMLMSEYEIESGDLSEV